MLDTASGSRRLSLVKGSAPAKLENANCTLFAIMSVND
jgi:hypothetical protein